MLAEDNKFPYVTGAEQASDPATPAAGNRKFYAKADGWYDIDDAGTVTGPFGIGGGGGGGGLAASYLGKNAIGASGWNFILGQAGIFKKITTVGAAQLLSVGAYIRQESDNPLGLGAALYSDSAGTPNRLLAFTMSDGASVLLNASSGETGASAAPRWFDMPLSYELAAATDYWVGLRSNNGSAVSSIAYDSGGSDRTHQTAQNWISDWGRYTAATTTYDHSIRARILS